MLHPKTKINSSKSIQILFNAPSRKNMHIYIYWYNVQSLRFYHGVGGGAVVLVKVHMGTGTEGGGGMI